MRAVSAHMRYVGGALRGGPVTMPRACNRASFLPFSRKAGVGLYSMGSAFSMSKRRFSGMISDDDIHIVEIQMLASWRAPREGHKMAKE